MVNLFPLIAFASVSDISKSKSESSWVSLTYTAVTLEEEIIWSVYFFL